MALLAQAQLPGGVTADIRDLLGYAGWIVLGLALAKISFVGARLAWDRKHSHDFESPNAAEFVAANAGAILIGVAGAIAVTLVGVTNGPQVGAPDGGARVIEQLNQLDLGPTNTPTSANTPSGASAPASTEPPSSR